MGWGGRELETRSPVYQSKQETVRTSVGRADVTDALDEELTVISEEGSKDDCQVLSLVRTS